MKLSNDDFAKLRTSLIGSWPNLAKILNPTDDEHKVMERQWRSTFAGFSLADMEGAVARLRSHLAQRGVGITPTLGDLEQAAKSERSQRISDTPFVRDPSSLSAADRKLAGTPRDIAEWEQWRIDEIEDFDRLHPGMVDPDTRDYQVAVIRGAGPLHVVHTARERGEDVTAALASVPREIRGPLSLADIVGNLPPASQSGAADAGPVGITRRGSGASTSARSVNQNAEVPTLPDQAFRAEPQAPGVPGRVGNPAPVKTSPKNLRHLATEALTAHQQAVTAGRPFDWFGVPEDVRAECRRIRDESNQATKGALAPQGGTHG